MIQSKNKHRFHSFRIKNLLEELDWNCSDQIHHYNSLNILHWYPASFITAIPGNVVEIFSDEEDVVWDPFCGSGITAVESYRMNRRFYGNDLNYVSILITTAKLRILEHFELLRTHFSTLKNQLEVFTTESKWGIKKSHKHKLSDIAIGDLKPWYSETTLNELLFLEHFLNTFDTPDQIKIVYKVIFLNIAKLACAQQKTWGHIADNVMPKKEQVESRKFDVIANFINRSIQVIEKAKRLVTFPTFQKYQLEAADSSIYCPSEPVDLVVTSPPYPYMIDYITSQRISYYWLNISKNDIDSIKTNEIGARYRRHRKLKVDEYLRDLVSAFKNITACLKKEGVLAILMPDYENGDNRKAVIDKFYKELSLMLNKMYHIKREVDLNNRWAPFRKLKNESLTIWCKND